MEQLHEPLVVQEPFVIAAHDQNAINRGIGLRFQKCRFPLQFCFRLFPPGVILATSSRGLKGFET